MERARQQQLRQREVREVAHLNRHVEAVPAAAVGGGGPVGGGDGAEIGGDEGGGGGVEGGASGLGFVFRYLRKIFNCILCNLLVTALQCFYVPYSREH